MDDSRMVELFMAKHLDFFDSHIANELSAVSLMKCM